MVGAHGAHLRPSSCAVGCHGSSDATPGCRLFTGVGRGHDRRRAQEQFSASAHDTSTLTRGGITVALTKEYPVPPFPNGWFRVAFSDELPPGSVKAVKYFGSDLVIFRGEDGH